MTARAALALVLATALPGSGAAATPAGASLEAPPGASSCSGCHAAASPAVAVPPIHGRPAAELLAALAAFRSGERPATVMNRIAPGFSQDEMRAIAEWLSRQSP